MPQHSSHDPNRKNTATDSTGNQNEIDQSKVTVHDLHVGFRETSGVLDEYVVDTAEKPTVQELKKLRLLHEHYGYTAFPPERIPMVLEKEQYRFDENGMPEKIVFTCSYDPPDRITDYGRSIFYYGDRVRGDSPFVAIAIYDRTKLIEHDPTLAYEFCTGSLVAIIRVYDSDG